MCPRCSQAEKINLFANGAGPVPRLGIFPYQWCVQYACQCNIDAYKADMRCGKVCLRDVCLAASKCSYILAGVLSEHCCGWKPCVSIMDVVAMTGGAKRCMVLRARQASHLTQWFQLLHRSHRCCHSFHCFCFLEVIRLSSLSAVHMCLLLRV